MPFFHVKFHQTEPSSLASVDLQRKGVISLNYVCLSKEITPFFEGLLKPNYCSQFDEILHEKMLTLRLSNKLENIFFYTRTAEIYCVKV